MRAARRKSSDGYRAKRPSYLGPLRALFRLCPRDGALVEESHRAFAAIRPSTAPPARRGISEWRTERGSSPTIVPRRGARILPPSYQGANFSPIEKWLGDTIGNPRPRPFLARTRRDNVEGVVGSRSPFPHGGKFGELRNAPEKLLALLEFEYGRPVADAIGELLSKLGHGDPDERVAKLSATVQGAALASRGPGSEAPEVSIVIPVHNALHHTLACIASIFAFPPTRSFEIIVGDDGSTDGTAKTLKSVAPAVRLVGRDVPVGFLENCNTAAQSAAGKFLVLLNNDTLVLPGSIDALIDTLESRRLAGLVGSRLIYPNGTLQEAGGIVFSDGSAANNGNTDDPLAPPYNSPARRLLQRGFRRSPDDFVAAARGLRRQVCARLLRGHGSRCDSGSGLRCVLPAPRERDSLRRRVPRHRASSWRQSITRFATGHSSSIGGRRYWRIFARRCCRLSRGAMGNGYW